MDSIQSSMAAAELIFPAPLSSSLESKLWSRSAVLSAVKSEGAYINNLLTTSSAVSTTNNNSNRSSGSCLANLMPVMDQSGKYISQPFSSTSGKYVTQPFSSTSDSMTLGEIDQTTRGFSTLSSMHRNQHSKIMLDNIFDDSTLGLNTASSELDNVWRLSYPGWSPPTCQLEEPKSESPGQCKSSGECRFPSEISEDCSLDGVVPGSSAVSSTSDGFATGAEQEDDVYVDSTATSVELPSMSNFTLSSPRLPSGTTMAIPSTCSESSPLSSDQVISCSLGSSLVELESRRLLNQTLPSVSADVVQNSTASKLPLRNDGNVLLVPLEPPTQAQDRKPQNERQLQTSSSMELTWDCEALSLDGSKNWSSKRFKPSPPPSPPPSSPTASPTLPVHFLAPNLPSVNGMNVNPPAPPTPFLISSNPPGVYQVPGIPTLGVSPADLTKVPPGTTEAASLPFIAPQFLFGASFPSMVNVDIREIENSRPKRRNVKISKDPQSVAARHRRERISDRIRVLQRLVPGGTKMDTASMLDEAISYVKYLKLQVQTLESCGNAGFDPRLQFPAYYLPICPVQGDCATVSQMFAPEVTPDNLERGSLLRQLSMKFPDTFREQFCH